MRFCAELEEILQQPLPVAALFKTQTMQELAEQLQSSSTVRPCAVVVIQSEGSQPPLFFINSTKPAKALQPLMGKDQPIYSLNIFGIRPLFEARPSSPTLLQEIAQQFVRDLLTVQPSGPYH